MEQQVRSRTQPGAHRDRRGDGAAAPARPLPRAGRRGRGFAGGTEGNERLTALTGLLLIVLFAALGITILRLGQFLWLHLFLGLLLLGPLALKLASTGYRFVRYYTRDHVYRVKGPPAPLLRLMAPALVGLTLAVFASGVVLMFVGPASGLRNAVFLVHKASFIAWIGLFGLHILGHLPELLRLTRVPGDTRARRTPPVSGGAARWVSLSTALVLGLVLAIVLIPDFGIWTSHTAGSLHQFGHDH